jgi:uncharacterized membrane protein YcaP (DUF421 family)
MPALSTLLEIVARVAIIYTVLLVLLRVSGRRELSELAPMELLTMLLISETVSPALTAGDDSVPGGLVAAGTLMALSVATSVLAFRSRAARRAIEGKASVLIKNGRVNEAVLRAERITSSDLEAKLHQHGLLSVAAVAYAFIEADGDITIIKKKDVAEGAT